MKKQKISELMPKRLTSHELHELSEYIDRLDANVGLSHNTITDIRSRILEAYQRV